MDYVGFLVVTAGHGVGKLSGEWKDKGDYLRSHALQSVALETAEGLAERIHHMMRDTWGYPDPADMTMKQRLGARYQGIRVSFGYPACPDLEDQEPLFKLMPRGYRRSSYRRFHDGTGGIGIRYGLQPPGGSLF